MLGNFNWLFMLAAVPMFSLLVLIHEWGHYFTAKRCGIRVEEFGLGFPPRLFAKKIGETEYSLNAIPLGGFVRMPGENGETQDSKGEFDPRSFGAKPAWQRAIVLSAGVFMNFLLCVVLFTIGFAAGVPGYPPVVNAVLPHTQASHAGLRNGDTILAINGTPVHLFSDLTPIVQGELSKSKESVYLTVVVRHAGEQTPQTLKILARKDPPAGQGPIGIMGLQDPHQLITYRPPLWETPWLGLKHTGEVLVQFVTGIQGMIRGTIAPQLTGPVGLVRITGEVASSVPQIGWFPLLNLTAIISLNLAFVNLLPFPALDGGRLALVLVEILRRGRKLDPRREGYLHLAGMAVLLSLVVVISWQDIANWLAGKPLF